MDKTRRIGVLTEMLKDKIESIEKRKPLHIDDEVNEAFGKHMAFILSKEEFSQFTVADLKPVSDVLVDFQNRYKNDNTGIIGSREMQKAQALDAVKKALQNPRISLNLKRK